MARPENLEGFTREGLLTLQRFLQSELQQAKSDAHALECELIRVDRALGQIVDRNKVGSGNDGGI